MNPSQKISSMAAERGLNHLLNLGIPQEDQNGLPKNIANFTLRGEIIEYPKFTLAIREIARRHIRAREARVAEGLLLVAQTGSGKSTLLEFYELKFPRSETPTHMIIPVLRIETPESPSIKMLAEAILYAMNDPAASKGNTTQKTNRIIHLFRECCVELLMIDEFHHFAEGRQTAESKRIANWLKNLINAVKIPVILAGLPRAISVLNSNAQLRRRFGAPHYMKPFGFTTKSEIKEFRGVLQGIDESLPCDCISLSEINMAKKMYYASHGLIDYVVKIVDDAISRGGTGPNGLVTLSDFADAFNRAIWMDAPNELNPFAGMKNFRLLNKPLEPFDIWDDIEKYTNVEKQVIKKKMTNDKEGKQ